MPKLAPFSLTYFLVLIATLTLLQICIAKDFNVVDFGAKADGKTESSSAFLKAWDAACKSDEESTLYIPGGTFYVNSISFNGACKKYMKIKIFGDLIAPENYQYMSNHQAWISFYKIDGLSISGGTIDAKGSSYWECKKGGKNCPYGARSLALQSCNNVQVNDLKSYNSEGVHISINECQNITMNHLTLTAPDDSPNTDGIHIGNSDHVNVLYSTIGTGDDCISIGPGSRHMLMDHITCGPGHGISIGSIGQMPNEDGVDHITVTNSSFTDTLNGVRIKSWARPSKAYVSNVFFENLEMRNAANPIIIDQQYCPQRNCPKASSGVKISDVKINNIYGTSRTLVALTLDCSSTNPCERITLNDINLYYSDKEKKSAAKAFCQNARVNTSGVAKPSC